MQSLPQNSGYPSSRINHLYNFNENLEKLEVSEFDISTQQHSLIISHLNQSVLAGEYYNICDDVNISDDQYYQEFDSILGKNQGDGQSNRKVIQGSAYRSLERLLNKAKESSLRPGAEENDSPENRFNKADLERVILNITNFCTFTKNAIDQYRKFSILVRKNLNSFGTRPLTSFTLNQSMENRFSNLEVASIEDRKDQNEREDLYLLFMLNLCLAELDESLNCEENVRRRLGRYINFLSNYITTKGTRDLVTTLLGKANYLFYKIEFRSYLNDRNRKDECVLPVPKRMAGYKKFQQRSLDHHERIGSLAIIPKVYNLGDIHAWNHYIRKQAKDLNIKINSLEEYRQSVNEILLELKDKKSIYSNRLFEYISYQSAYNLLFNTNLELLLQEERRRNYSTVIKQLTASVDNADFGIPFILDLLNELKEHQSLVKILDYYPYQGLLYFLNDFLDYVRQEPSRLGLEMTKMDTKAEEGLITLVGFRGKYVRELFQQIFLTFRSRLRWCRDQHYNPIYLSIDQCKSDELFLDSSYILPDHFKRLEQKWEMAEQQAAIEIRLIEDLLKVEIHRNTTDNSFDSKKKEVEDILRKNEFRTVQIVAMFVSIATFVLSQVKIFENRNLNASLSIMFGFAAGLMLFNAFFKWIINGSLVISQDKDGPVVDVPDLVLIALIIFFGCLSYKLAIP